MRIVCAIMTALTLCQATTLSVQPGSDLKSSKEEKAAAEIKKLEGKWKIESAKLAGRDFPASPELRWEFAGFTMMNSVPGKPETQTMRTITLDPSTDPKRITMIEAELKNGIWLAKPDGDVVRAVYALDGDKLTLVQWRGPKPDYPKSVTPKAGEPVMEMVLRRIRD